MFHIIADQFSWSGWRHEAAERLFPAHDRETKRELEKNLATLGTSAPRFLLIESIWENWGRWKRKPKKQFAFLEQLIERYRSHGIPTVFWSKEDPPHFERFLPWATLCDLVLTTDVNCVPKYRERGCQAVHPMIFAAQPAIHKNYFPQEKTVCFAGSWNKHHPTRVEGVEALIDPLLDRGLEIFSRMGKWPQTYRGHIVGAYPYEELLRKYSAYQIGLSISSVRESPTMFPRRVLEMSCAGLLVLSDRCRGVTTQFPDIPCSTSARKTLEVVDYYTQHESERIELASKIRSQIIGAHTYRHRVEYIESLLEETASIP